MEEPYTLMNTAYATHAPKKIQQIMSAFTDSHDHFMQGGDVRQLVAKGRQASSSIILNSETLIFSKLSGRYLAT